MSNTTNTVVTKAPELEAVVEASMEQVRKNLKEKVKVVKGIVYNPQKVKTGQFSAQFKADMSKAYAFKLNTYEVDSKYRNNVQYLSSMMSALEKKDSLSKSEQARYELCKADRARSQACLSAWTKMQKKSIQPTLDDIEARLYDAYTERQVDRQGWVAALTRYFASYNMPCSESLVEFINDNIGSRVAKKKDYHKCMVDNHTPSQFSDLFLALMLQLSVDKAQFDMKIIKSTLKGTEEVMIEEFDQFITVKHFNPIGREATIEKYRSILVEVGAELPKSNAKKAEWKEAYEKAKKQGLFVEYTC